VNRELPGAPVGEIKLQRSRDRAEGDLVPRDFALVEQAHFQTLGSGREIEVEQLGTKKNVHLLDVGYIEHRKKRPESDARAGFFDRLTLGALCSAFADLHEPGWKRPLSIPRLDGALAKQDLIAPHGNRAYYRSGIYVVNLAAVIAAIALAIVAGRNPAQHRRTAHGAEARIGRKHGISLQDEALLKV